MKYVLSQLSYKGNVVMPLDNTMNAYRGKKDTDPSRKTKALD